MTVCEMIMQKLNCMLMKKNMVLIVITLMATLTTHAQKGAIQLSPAIELGLPVGRFVDNAKFGVGLSIKGLYGISDNGNITLTVGSSIYTERQRLSSVLTPFLAGYRHSLNGFYIEPQLGYSFNTVHRIWVGGPSHSEHINSVAWAFGVGYASNHIDLGVRFQHLGTENDPFEEHWFNAIVLKIGYTFRLNHRK